MQTRWCSIYPTIGLAHRPLWFREVFGSLTARQEAPNFKRQSKKYSWNTLCEEIERAGCHRNQKANLSKVLAKSYRKGQQHRPFTIKMKDSDEIITEPEEVQKCWTDYFPNLKGDYQKCETYRVMSLMCNGAKLGPI